MAADPAARSPSAAESAAAEGVSMALIKAATHDVDDDTGATVPDAEGAELTEAYAGALSSFVPEIVKHSLKQQADRLDVQTLRAPWSVSFKTAALFADVSGFTSLTLRLSKKGTLGAEQLPRIINAYMGQIVRKIISYGGDVVKFAGDALLCVWPPSWDHLNDPVLLEEDLKNAVHQSVKCALDIQQEFGVMDLDPESDKSKSSSSEKSELSIKMGIGAGTCSLLVVGGEFNRCEYLVCGDALMQAFSCEETASILAKKGRTQLVILSQQGHSLVRDKVKVEKVDSDTNLIVSKAKGLHKAHFEKLALDVRLAQLMKGYLPVAVAPHLKMPNTFWTGELREVTCVFISLPFSGKKLSSIKYDEPNGNRMLVRLQNHIRLMQKIIYQYEGSLNKFLVDDKGSTVIGAFGLPPVAHNNDPTRAVLASIELAHQFQRINRFGTAALGIASGVVFSGLIGGAGSRREYTILGSQVNMAARLMGVASKNSSKMGNVLCDKTIVAKTKHHPQIAWECVGEVQLKNIEGMTSVFRPIRQRMEITAYKITTAKTLEASDTENIHKVSQVLSEVSVTSKSAVIFLEGEIMMGKTTLLEQIQVQNGLRAWFLWGKGDCFHSLHPVNNIVWKMIFLEFSKQYSLTLSRHRYKLLTWIKARRPDLVDFAFLLGDMVDLGTDLEPPFSKNEVICIELGSKEKLWQMRFDLVICTLEWVARCKPIAIVLDEIQWFDRRDWQLTRRLCFLIHLGVVKNVVVIIGASPMDNARYVPHFTPAYKIAQYTQMRDNMSTLVINPEAWTREKVRSYLCKSLGVTDCSVNLVEIVWCECGGRPGFVDLFLQALRPNEETKNLSISGRDGHSITVPSSAAMSAGAIGDWVEIEVNKKDPSLKRASFISAIEDKIKSGIDVAFPIPPYIRSVTAAHLDCISTELLMCLKVASVITKAKGNAARLFEEDMVRGMHPVPDFAMPARLRRTLTDLENMKFIRRTGSVSMGPGGMTELSSTASKAGRTVSTGGGLLSQSGISDPMPSILSLLQPPLAHIPYKKGYMYKRSAKILRGEKTRYFIFRHTTLYWLKTPEKEQYPINRIKFGSSTKVTKTDSKTIKVRAEKKDYLLRCDKSDDATEWYNLFSHAIVESQADAAVSMESSESSEGGKSPRKRREESSDRSSGTDIDDERMDSSMDRSLNDSDDDVVDDDDEEMDEDDLMDSNVYEFSFGFLRDVIYEGMLHSQRQILHQNGHKFLSEMLERMEHTDEYTYLLQVKHQEFGMKLENMQRHEETLPADGHSRLMKKKRKSRFVAT